MERSSYAPYEGMKLGFRLYLKQVGSRVVGTGEKVQENGSSGSSTGFRVD